MNKPLKHLTLLIICIYLVQILLGCSIQTNRATDVIARVNDMPITKAEFNLNKANLELTSFEEVTNVDVLKSLIKRKLLAQEARNMGVGISDEEFKEQIDKLNIVGSDVEVPSHIVEAITRRGFNSYNEFLQSNNLKYESFKEHSIASALYFLRDNIDAWKLESIIKNETYTRLLSELRENNSEIGQGDLYKIDREYHKVAKKEIYNILQNADIQILDPSFNITHISFDVEEDLEDSVLTFKGEGANWRGLYIQDNATGTKDKFMFTYKGKDKIEGIRLTKVAYTIDARNFGFIGLWMQLNEEGIAYLNRPFELEENNILTVIVEWYTPKGTFEETFEISLVPNYIH